MHSNHRDNLDLEKIISLKTIIGFLLTGQKIH